MSKCSCNKIVLIGGSNVGFGFDSQMLAKTFNMPVFNTGTHAGLGLRLQIELFKDYMNTGDIIVLMPEYQQFYGLFLGDETMVRIVASNDFFKKNISLKQLIHSAKYIFPVLNNLEEVTDSTGVYGSCSLNKYGDISLIRKHEMSPGPQIIKGEFDYNAISYLKTFMADCPATVILLPQVIQDKAFDMNTDKIKQIDSVLCENGLGYDAEPIRYRFNDILIYDVSGHCTTEGAAIRTQLVIEDMYRILGK